MHRRRDCFFVMVRYRENRSLCRLRYRNDEGLGRLCQSRDRRIKFWLYRTQITLRVGN